ncbi:GNAT family N-acetyltransferase [Sneathiella sp.]|jgi:predicted N-acyltransferase|uniref:GNAT family N-acetyltransferase n=1 Tax=Sneathiella sp. TaxID=1964365 RepID=UPI0039E4BEFD
MTNPLSISTLQNISEVEEQEWNKCVSSNHPFIQYGFLKALEESGSATAETGWMPYHLVLRDHDTVVGVAPQYIKGHSQGEYVFDHSWAHAYERAGGRYYPKLQLSIPFSPVTGPRFLAMGGEKENEYKSLLMSGAKQIATKLGISSVHATFVQEHDLPLLEDNGYMIRTGEQFHWVNQDYTDFDDFLSQLSSRKRKAIRKERKEANNADLTFEIKQGAEITEEHWDAFFAFYIDTGNRKWGTPYLTRSFFSLLGPAMGSDVVLFMVKREGRYIAAALNLKSDECLYGRYWGCIEDHRFLHFETCYYRAIDYAIEHGLKRVEAGAQGPHKLARGYLPTKTYSAHWMQDPGFHDAVSDFLKAETRDMNAEIQYLSNHSPYKKV